jgi:hypothetical protein
MPYKFFRKIHKQSREINIRTNGLKVKDYDTWLGGFRQQTGGLSAA